VFWLIETSMCPLMSRSRKSMRRLSARGMRCSS
jgi:hypothetical protein